MKNEESHVPRRLNLLFFIVFIFFTILLLRLAGVQLVKGEEYLMQSESNSTTTLSMPAPRGWMMDRNGELLVSNRPAFVVTFTEVPNVLVDYEGIAARLETVLDLPQEDILRAMDYKAPRRLPRYLPRQLKTDVDQTVVAYITEHKDELPGVNVVVEPIREYRYGNLAVHAIGYISPIPEHQRDFYRDMGYRLDEKVGIDGLEKQYEEFLRGTAGQRVVEVNRFSQPIRELSMEAPVRGADLTLTIDKRLQEASQKIIEEQLEILRTRERDPIPDVKEAVAVAMNPITGEILAMASYPSYDPNVFTKRPLSQETVDYLFTSEGNLPLLNRAVDAAYEPGSTVKMATTLMGLQEGVINANTQIFDNGSLYIGNWSRPFRSWAWHRGGHGWNDPKQAIQVSNNVYMYQIALWISGYPNSQHMNWSRVRNAPPTLRESLKSDWQRNRDLHPAIDTFKEYFAMFGLGVKTGIDLPKDSSGWPMNVNEIGELAFTAIGQNMTLTAMQLAQYTSTIANGGERLAPYLVKEVTDNRGRTLLERDKDVLNVVDIDPQHIRVMQEGMLMVTMPGGTAYNTFLGFPESVAAKTGTAQTGVEGRTNATFVGYAPYENPEIAVSVIVPNGGGGSDTSGMIARRILEEYFHLQNIDIE
ncbi:penicillin-binding protein 2 [Desulfuribacillus alkaliarsenatis]|uniref:Penicillin-binding protein 2 n=1 Tax=Desulfuribacillus alkaliarsenatis TaxID=766136 RepID=A0A1E5G5G4_9FIRM|nr:penicillin-binding protein 2 [Desulfuribacillus alkaliarsenatis]OEF98349.1 penicillin-binding protein 2 [Desulfuribacillus alkaliarsenatis]